MLHPAMVFLWYTSSSPRYSSIFPLSFFLKKKNNVFTKKNENFFHHFQKRNKNISFQIKKISKFIFIRKKISFFLKYFCNSPPKVYLHLTKKKRRNLSYLKNVSPSFFFSKKWMNIEFRKMKLIQVNFQRVEQKNIWVSKKWISFQTK